LAIPRDSIATLVGELRAGPRRTAVGARRIDLTSRERNVFELLENGLTTQEMAARLGISTVTVRRHLGAIAAKAGTRGVARLRLLVEA
jgi:DNA-binding CsgD family transcriptional regulator